MANFVNEDVSNSVNKLIPYNRGAWTEGLYMLFSSSRVCVDYLNHYSFLTHHDRNLYIINLKFKDRINTCNQSSYPLFSESAWIA